MTAYMTEPHHPRRIHGNTALSTFHIDPLKTKTPNNPTPADTAAAKPVGIATDLNRSCVRGTTQPRRSKRKYTNARLHPSVTNLSKNCNHRWRKVNGVTCPYQMGSGPNCKLREKTPGAQSSSSACLGL